MNIKEYISSGIIESYVLGLASDAERQEFEALCRQYPELAQARSRFEQALEAELLADAPAAPVFLKERVLSALSAEAAAPPAAVPLQRPAQVRPINPWKWAAAACALLAAGALWWAVSTSRRNDNLQAGTASTGSADSLRQQLDATRGELAELKREADMLRNPNLKMTALQSVPTAPTRSHVTVMWDTTSKDVYLMIQNLPAPASGKQYQLWALIDKKPVDLGVFELRQDKLMVKMKNVQNAQAFAITLEPKGGSEAPTLQNMYVYGEL
ncbi:anti-sigma factor [Flaviaesturariibacter aridisoli]|uniref:anti-sigma factor n=1 Tax=Flaviaesturariibacter aridisoli TaxID=2545761 RepID=UPI0014054056|nr:anti-sigma factor [Flaviaesturariibacter aridisoli]